MIFNTPSGYTVAVPMTLFIEPPFGGSEPPPPPGGGSKTDIVPTNVSGNSVGRGIIYPAGGNS